MKIKILSTLLITLTITGCQKQQAENPTENRTAKTQFEKSDVIIGNYLDRLDNPNTPKAEQINIICKDYPAEYKNHYMPALLQLQPHDYTETKLLNDLDMAVNYYKEKLNIGCS